MNPVLLVTVAILYGGVAIQYLTNHRPWMGLVFLGYAIAQLGFVMEVKR